MRKHTLLSHKIKIANNLPWYVKLSNEQLSQFSLNQLSDLSEILNSSENFREKCNPWYSLDVNRSVRKPISGEPEIIVEVNGLSVKTLTSEEVSSTAANRIYKNYKEKTT